LREHAHAGGNRIRIAAQTAARILDSDQRLAGGLGAARLRAHFTQMLAMPAYPLVPAVWHSAFTLNFNRFNY
jgi:hypothetical protein